MENFVFHPDVKEDIQSSYYWYQEQAQGLGDDFLAELEISYEIISELPNTWPTFQKSFRRYLLSRFPYSVIYRKSGKKIFVVAIMHNRRKPGYWHERT